MKTKLFICAIISTGLLLSDVFANDNSTSISSQPEFGKCNEVFLTNFMVNPDSKKKDEDQIDSNSSEKLLYISNDNSFVIFESHPSNLNQLVSKESLFASKIKDNKTGFQYSNFYVFNNPLNVNFRLSHDNQEHIYTCIKDKKNMNIYQSHFNGKNWSAPQKLESPINSRNNETSACLSRDGKTIYFTSDRKGGFGGLDIWKSELLESGEWGSAINLGPEVNSAFDDESPYFLADGVTMYFSSKGHNSTGGFDVFCTTLSEEGTWSQPANVGFPINTKDDELNFKISSDEKFAFYSSSKDCQKGSYKIVKTQFNPNSVVQM